MACLQSIRTSQTWRFAPVDLGLIGFGLALMGTWVYELLDLYPAFVLGGMTIVVGDVFIAVGPPLI